MHRRATDPSEPGPTTDALSPVTEALFESARSRADELAAAAESDARAELERAWTEAERILEGARAEGRDTATHRVNLQLAAARREARGTVLAARRRAYDELRRQCLESLEGQAATPQGTRLSAFLGSLVHERVGESADVVRLGPGSLGVRATLRNRGAQVGPEVLVDTVLRTLGSEVESLWT